MSARSSVTARYPGPEPPERARCVECDAEVHGAEHLHPDPARGRDRSADDDALLVCEPCDAYLRRVEL